MCQVGAKFYQKTLILIQYRVKNVPNATKGLIVEASSLNAVHVTSLHIKLVQGKRSKGQRRLGVLDALSHKKWLKMRQK